MKPVPETPPDAGRDIVREHLIQLEEWARDFEARFTAAISPPADPPKEPEGWKQINMQTGEVIDAATRRVVGHIPSPAPNWSNAPKPEGKWRRHPSSERILLDRRNNTHMVSALTEAQLAEARADLNGEFPEPPEVTPQDE